MHETGRMRVRLSPRATGVVATVLFVTSLLIAVQWNAVKEHYFNAALASCQAWHGVSKVRWKSLPTFDGQTRRIVAETNAEKAMVVCATRWARPIVDRFASPSGLPWPKGALQVEIGGFMYNPPQRIFDVSYVHVRPDE